MKVMKQTKRNKMGVKWIKGRLLQHPDKDTMSLLIDADFKRPRAKRAARAVENVNLYKFRMASDSVDPNNFQQVIRKEP